MCLLTLCSSSPPPSFPDQKSGGLDPTCEQPAESGRKLAPDSSDLRALVSDSHNKSRHQMETLASKVSYPPPPPHPHPNPHPNPYPNPHPHLKVSYPPPPSRPHPHPHPNPHPHLKVSKIDSRVASIEGIAKRLLEDQVRCTAAVEALSMKMEVSMHADGRGSDLKP